MQGFYMYHDFISPTLHGVQSTHTTCATRPVWSTVHLCALSPSGLWAHMVCDAFTPPPPTTLLSSPPPPVTLCGKCWGQWWVHNAEQCRDTTIIPGLGVDHVWQCMLCGQAYLTSSILSSCQVHPCVHPIAHCMCQTASCLYVTL